MVLFEALFKAVIVAIAFCMRTRKAWEATIFLTLTTCVALRFSMPFSTMALNRFVQTCFGCLSLAMAFMGSRADVMAFLISAIPFLLYTFDMFHLLFVVTGVSTGGFGGRPPGAEAGRRGSRGGMELPTA